MRSPLLVLANTFLQKKIKQFQYFIYDTNEDKDNVVSKSPPHSDLEYLPSVDMVDKSGKEEAALGTFYEGVNSFAEEIEDHSEKDIIPEDSKYNFTTIRIVLKQCNQDKFVSLAKRIADESDEMFGQFLSPYEVRELSKCLNYEDTMSQIKVWLSPIERTVSDEANHFSENIFYDYYSIDESGSGQFEVQTFSNVQEIMESRGLANELIGDKEMKTASKILEEKSSFLMVSISNDRIPQLFPQNNFEPMYSPFHEAFVPTLIDDFQPTLPNSLKDDIAFILGLEHKLLLAFEQEDSSGRRRKLSQKNMENKNERTEILGYIADVDNKIQIVDHSFNHQTQRKNHRRLREKQNSPSKPKAPYKSVTLSTIQDYYKMQPATEYYPRGQGFCSLAEEYWDLNDLRTATAMYATTNIEANPLIQLSEDIYDKSILENITTVGYEANLDIQLISLVGGGSPTFTYIPGGYENYKEITSGIEMWLLDIIEDDALLPPSGPYVWSISYGSDTTYTEYFMYFNKGNQRQKYIDFVENELAKMAVLGVSIIVASGDSGSCNMNLACESDSQWPVTFTGAETVYYEEAKCNSFTMVANIKKEDEGLENIFECNIPMGYQPSEFFSTWKGHLNKETYGTSVGGECEEVMKICYNVIMERGEQDSYITTSESGCKYMFDPLGTLETQTGQQKTLMINSDCSCDAIDTEIGLRINDQCTIKPFKYNREKYNGLAAISSDYPATSKFVTSIGATALPPLIIDEGNPNWGSSLSEIIDIYGQKESSNLPNEVIPYKFSGGGGFSNYIEAPWYQKEYSSYIQDWYESSSQKPSVEKLGYNIENRAIPDLAVFGQDISVIINGREIKMLGTSAGAPIFAGMITRLNNERMNQGLPAIGEINPHIYRLMARDSTIFTQIPYQPLSFPTEKGQKNDISGEPFTIYGVNMTKYLNIAYSAKYSFTPNKETAWNPATGFGSPVFSKLSEYFTGRVDMEKMHRNLRNRGEVQSATRKEGNIKEVN